MSVPLSETLEKLEKEHRVTVSTDRTDGIISITISAPEDKLKEKVMPLVIGQLKKQHPFLSSILKG